MKQTFLTFLFLGFIFNLQLYSQSKEVTFLIDTSLTILKKQSLMKDAVNWDSLKTNMLTLTKGLNDSIDLRNAMGYLYKFLNDPHGSLKYKGKGYGWFREMPAVDDSLDNEFNKGDFVRTQLLQNKIGYLRIPSMNHKYADSLVKQLNDSLCYLLAHNIRGLVIDLRLNGGGSMAPMILGVKQLLGDIVVTGFQTNDSSMNVSIKNDAIYYDSRIKLQLKPACHSDASLLPVVLITSFETASSGEALVVSFKGRPNTIILGVPTQGLTNALTWNKINDIAEIGVAAAWAKDRNGVVYKTAIQPDIYMNEVNKMNDIPHDPKIMAAIKWLTSHSK